MRDPKEVQSSIQTRLMKGRSARPRAQGGQGETQKDSQVFIVVRLSLLLLGRSRQLTKKREAENVACREEEIRKKGGNVPCRLGAGLDQGTGARGFVMHSGGDQLRRVKSLGERSGHLFSKTENHLRTTIK